MSNKKNPLFVVTNRGRDVQEAFSLWDALATKWNLEAYWEAFQVLFDFFLGQAQNYAFFMAFKEWFDQFIEFLERVTKRIDPLLAFSLFPQK